jgi:hypothetical protein
MRVSLSTSTGSGNLVCIGDGVCNDSQVRTLVGTGFWRMKGSRQGSWGTVCAQDFPWILMGATMGCRCRLKCEDSRWMLSYDPIELGIT